MARMEPPSLTREPRGPFCVATVADMLRLAWHRAAAAGQVTKVKALGVSPIPVKTGLAATPLGAGRKRAKPRLYGESVIALPEEVRCHGRSHRDDEPA